MEYSTQAKQVAALQLAVVRGRASRHNVPATIRTLFDKFYAGYKGRGGLNTVLYSACDEAGEMEIACGIQVERDGNASTPAGHVATTVYIGPYDRMKPAHDAIHQWARDNRRKLTGVSWEVYGHWNEDPARLRTDIFYQLAE